MRTDSISRRLAAIEERLLPKVPAHLQYLSQSPAFVGMLDAHGVSVDVFLRNGLSALPRDLLRALVDRLKVAMMAPAG